MRPSPDVCAHMYPHILHRNGNVQFTSIWTGPDRTDRPTATVSNKRWMPVVFRIGKLPHRQLDSCLQTQSFPLVPPPTNNKFNPFSFGVPAGTILGLPNPLPKVLDMFLIHSPRSVVVDGDTLKLCDFFPRVLFAS